jgi:uncharacterized protein
MYDRPSADWQRPFSKVAAFWGTRRVFYENLLIRRRSSRLFVSLMLLVFAMVSRPRVAVAEDFSADSSGNSGASFADIKLPRPGQHEFILDQANLLSEADKTKIRQISEKVLKDKAAPIIVVTIDSMAHHGGGGLRIETFAQLLFDQWGVGPAKVANTPWNYGIMLLVARDDRQARIQLGAGWRHDKDVQTEQIMEEQIIPRFKQGNYSGGIVAGVESLDKMARNLQLPSRPRSTAEYVVPAVIGGLGLFTIISLIRRGSSGWAWIFWAAVLGVIGAILYQMANSQSRGGGMGGGGGFSGGSFGGGFSGGGGASGSW